MRAVMNQLRDARLSRTLPILGVAAIGAATMLGLSTSARAENAKPAAPAAATAPAAPAKPAAHAEGPALTGFWQAYNDDDRPGGIFYFYENHGLYEGRLVKSIVYPNEPPDDPLCKACTGEKKNKPMMGLVIVYDMKRHGAAKYEDGHILDPRDGKVWSAELEVTPDNKKLNLRGYIGTPLFGQTRVWTRLPDETMALVDIPGDPLPGAPAKKPAAAAAGAAPSAAPAPAAPKPAAPKAQ